MGALFSYFLCLRHAITLSRWSHNPHNFLFCFYVHSGHDFIAKFNKHIRYDDRTTIVMHYFKHEYFKVRSARLDSFSLSRIH